MSYSKDEIEELKKRDLLIARRLGNLWCTTLYDIGLFSRKGEEAKSYVELWKKKVEATKEKIKTSQTIEETFNIVDEFRNGFTEYVRATKVDTADKAMDIAHSFIKKYVPVALPMKAEREGDVWLVDIDVGALAVKMAKVKVDARTGDILSYEIPPK